MASYSVVVKASVEKDLRGLPKPVTKRVYSWFTSLRTNPFPEGAVKVVGSQNRYRIRVGDYRIIYGVDQDAKQVTIHYVRHRRDVYR